METSINSDSDETGLQLMSGKSAEKNKQKTEIAQSQHHLIDELVDLRAKMQTVLILMNRLPQGNLKVEFMKRNEDVQKKTAELEINLTSFMDSLVSSDISNASKNPSIYGGKGGIGLLTEAQLQLDPKDGNHYYAYINAMISRKRSWEESTVSHWTKRAQVQSGKTLKLNALNKGIFEQVDSIMEDDVRWRKRCNVIRGDYHIIGEDDEAPEDDGQRRNVNIYDDQEFYNGLLNQYASLSMNTNASVIKKRVSKKKEIQRKASKGRRMIYTIHPKLQNFCAPEKYPPAEIDVTQLFSSLFGKNTN